EQVVAMVDRERVLLGELHALFHQDRRCGAHPVRLRQVLRGVAQGLQDEIARGHRQLDVSSTLALGLASVMGWLSSWGQSCGCTRAAMSANGDDARKPRPARLAHA